MTSIAYCGLVLAAIFLAAAVPELSSMFSPAFAEEGHTEFAANLLYIKGHLDQALVNKQANDSSLAAAHAGHPVGEVYALIEEELTEHDPELDEELEQGLTSFANQIATMTSQEVETEVANLNTLLDRARSSVINQTESADPTFNAKVAIAVLETAEHEYEEAVENGEVVEMIEYQDSTAFISQARTIFDSSIKSGMPEEEGDEVIGFFDDLDSLTASNADFQEVERTIGAIVHEFEEVFSLEEPAAYDGQAYIDKIIELLDEAVIAYEQGDADKAEALAVEAYLENYENIERDIEEDNPELMVKIELDLREELVDMIQQGKPASEIQEHVNQIKSDLETARAVVVPEFPTAIIATACVAVGIAISRFKGIGRLKWSH